MNEKAARCIKRAAFCIFSGFWNVTRNARGVTWNLRRNRYFLQSGKSKIQLQSMRNDTLRKQNSGDA